MVAGGYLVTHHHLSLGELFAFLAIAFGRFGPGLHGLAIGLGVLVGSLGLWSRVFAVLDRAVEVEEREDARPLPSGPGSVEFDAVTFTYPGQRRPALTD